MTSLAALPLRLLALLLLSIGLSACSSTDDFIVGSGNISLRGGPKVVRKGAVLNVKTTAYTHTEADHLIYGRQNAIGTTLRSSGVMSAAADWSRFPLGTTFKLLDNNQIYMVDDYGSALVGTNTLDLYRPSKISMDEWGNPNKNIQIIKIGSYEQSLAILRDRESYSHVRTMVASLEKQLRRRDVMKAAMSGDLGAYSRLSISAEGQEEHNALVNLSRPSSGNNSGPSLTLARTDHHPVRADLSE